MWGLARPLHLCLGARGRNTQRGKQDKEGRGEPALQTKTEKRGRREARSNRHQGESRDQAIWWKKANPRVALGARGPILNFPCMGPLAQRKPDPDPTEHEAFHAGAVHIYRVSLVHVMVAFVHHVASKGLMWASKDQSIPSHLVACLSKGLSQHRPSGH